VPPSTSIVSSAEVERKREAALAAAGPFATNDPATVRWLLCGRGRPVDVTSRSPYAVQVDEGGARVYYQDIERSRVESEERWDELGFEPVPYPWFEPLPVELTDVEAAVAPLRRALTSEEAERYRAAGADAAAAMVEAIEQLEPRMSELEAAGQLAGRVSARGLNPFVVLVGGEERQPLHRHPLPTAAPLGRHALLAVTAERDGLHVSLTRLVSMGEPSAELAGLVRAVAEVDAAMLDASRPGTTTGEVLTAAADTYAALGFPEEWRRHHQGGITGYRGREVFATPGEPTPLPDLCAVAWNPSIAGGAKSEDTALVSAEGVEVVTRTPSLPEIELRGVVRPLVAIL
jgi:Xaa-Pro dipeptidase